MQQYPYMRNIIRNAQGRFAAYNWKQLERRMIISIMVLGGVVLGGGLVTDNYSFLEKWAARAPLTYTAEASVLVTENRTVAQMKQDLIHIIWAEESGKYVPKAGEILPTFDPNSSEYPSCIKRGGRMPLYCISYGPMQIKLSTLIGFSEQIYGKKVTEKEARDIAEDLETAQDFFLQCSIKIKGCVYHWTKAKEHKMEVETLIKYIRLEEGIKMD